MGSALCSTTATATSPLTFRDLVGFLVHSFSTTGHCLRRPRTPRSRQSHRPVKIATEPTSVPLQTTGARSPIRQIHWSTALRRTVHSATKASMVSLVSTLRQTTPTVVAPTAPERRSLVCSSSIADRQHIPIPRRRQHHLQIIKTHLVVLLQSRVICRLVSPGTQSQMDMCVMAIRKVRSSSASNSTWPAAILATPCLVRCPNLTTNLLL